MYLVACHRLEGPPDEAMGQVRPSWDGDVVGVEGIGHVLEGMGERAKSMHAS